LLLIANDWWFKPSAWAQGFLTGKLSDIAGLVFFPLLLTACTNCAALGLHRLGLSIDFTLRRYKAVSAIALTALVFSAVKLSPSCNHLVLEFISLFGLHPSIVLDATDLYTLPALGVAWLVARGEIARVPLGRIELIEIRHKRKGVGVGTLLDDIVPAGGTPVHVAELTEAFNDYLAAPSSKGKLRVERALAAMRDLSLPGR
tara:strand:+ start:66315 stop:66920 length:606 start_codon:yes stop_codon:yes gene_type:complete